MNISVYSELIETDDIICDELGIIKWWYYLLIKK
jgi:hypothetical protein